MTIIGFMEGTHRSKGGLGLVGVPTILGGVAGRGHRVALVTSGGCTPGRERFLTGSLDEALKRKEGVGNFGMVAFKSGGAWGFSPWMLWKVSHYVRNADFVSLHSLYSFPVLAGYLLARFHNVPYGVWPHGVLANVQRRISARKKRIYDALVGRSILNKADVLFFSAVGERADSVSLGLRAPSVIIPDGIDLSDFAALPSTGRFRAKYFPGHSGPLVVSIGRLNPKKGLDLLIQSMSIVMKRRPDVRLAIIGPPDPVDYLQRVMSHLRNLQMEARTVVTGTIEPREKLEALVDADVFVSASEAENFGYSIFEAMACEKAVVVSDTIDYAGEISRTGAGLAVPRDTTRFATAVERLLVDEDLREAMGKQGRRLAESYSWINTGAKLERAIQSVLERRPLPTDLTMAASARVEGN